MYEHGNPKTEIIDPSDILAKGGPSAESLLALARLAFADDEITLEGLPELFEGKTVVAAKHPNAARKDYIGIAASSVNSTEHSAVIDGIAVAEDCRREGVSSFLVQGVRNAAGAIEGHYVSLATHPTLRQKSAFSTMADFLAHHRIHEDH